MLITNDEDMSQLISKNLRKLMQISGLSENELARRTGIAQQIINRLLSGKNQNPKIATLTPISNFFKISMSQLIGEETLFFNFKNSWQEVPLIDWSVIEETSLEKLCDIHTKISIESLEENIFATQVCDESMTPRFPKASLIIFSHAKKPSDGDFVLIIEAKILKFRQYFIKAQLKSSECKQIKQQFVKCLNPNHIDYSPSCLSEEVKILGVLVQARINY